MGFPVLNHRVMKLRQSQGVEMHTCDDTYDVTTHIYVSNTMAFSFRGNPLIQGVCPGYD